MPLCRQRRRIFLALGAALFVGPSFASAQGFGIVKKNVTLVRSLPPVIDLADARVSVQVSGAGACARIDDLVKAKLVAFVFSNRSLAEDNANPDRIIDVGLTECYTSYETDRRDGSQLVKGTIRASYRTIDNRTKHSLDAQNLGADYERRFAPPQQRQAAKRPGFLGTLDQFGAKVAELGGKDVGQPPKQPELISQLVEDVAKQVAQRVVLMEDRQQVPLPRGSFDQASSLAEAGRWGAMLEQLEQAAPLAGADDAYRLYGIGVACEALAYADSDRSVQRDLIARASQEYKAALRLKPDEGEFRRAENRIASSLAALDATAALGTDAAAASGTRGQPAAPAGTTGGSQWTNAAVIELFREGLTETALIEAIRSAPSPAFDVVSPTGLLQLKRSGLPETVIRAMRERMKAAGGGGQP